jgi:lysophospholipase L1-like esterase
MNNRISILLLISGMLNILFVVAGIVFIARRGGVYYLSSRILDFVNSKNKVIQGDYQPYYLHQTSLFQILPKSNSQIIFLGDSITDECEWAELLENPSIKNRGISGDTTKGILNRLDDIVESQPEKIFLMVGINNFIHYAQSTEEILIDYKQIITEIRNKSPSTKIFIQSVLPVNNTRYGIGVNNNKVIQLNLSLKELAKEFSLRYIDLFSHLSDSQNQLDSYYTLDGVHLNGQAYLVWKQVIEQYIGESELNNSI